MLVKNTDVFELCITLTSNWCLYAEHSNSKMLNIYTNIFSNWCIGVKETKVRSYKQRCFELLGSKNSNSEINSQFNEKGKNKNGNLLQQCQINWTVILPFPFCSTGSFSSNGFIALVGHIHSL